MYDRKTVRRRRAVLGLLVACSLILLTAYFGEGTGGGLHSVQRGVAEVVSPIESVASGALKPFRDLFGWVGDTFHAKTQVKSLRAEVRRYRSQNIADSDAAAQGRYLLKMFKLDEDLGLDPSSASLVTANVISQSPNVWYSTININKGTSAGVRKNAPVIDADGLVGEVTQVWGNGATIQLITDSQSGVAAKVAGTAGKALITGIVSTGSPGNPNDLLLGALQVGKTPQPGETVVTSGIASTNYPSWAPEGIPIGQIRSVDPNELATSQQVHITPFASLRNLDVVQVITKPSA